MYKKALVQRGAKCCNGSMAYSKDLKEKLIAHLAKGHTMREAKDAFSVGLDTVNNWAQRLKETGSLENRKPQGAHKKLDPEKLRAYVAEHPDAYLAEIGEAFGCCGSAVCRVLARLGITRKKKSKRFSEQNPERVAEYLAELEKVSGRPVVYVDETGMDTWLHREHGWSERGAPVEGEARGRRCERTGVVAALWENTIIAPYQYGGTMDSEFFEGWFESALLPALPGGSVIVMDNATFHRKAKLRALLEGSGHALLSLPPYSPEFNPIEHFWSWLKRRLRKILPLHTSFSDALCSAFQVN